jgi:hypothetical protein
MTFDELIAHLNASGAEGLKHLERYTPEFVDESLGELATIMGFYIALTKDDSLSPIDVAGRRIAVYTAASLSQIAERF